MKIFPDNVPIQYPLKTTQQYKTLISKFESGSEQRRLKQAFPKREFTVNFFLTVTQADILRAFHKECKGAFEPFYFFYPIIKEEKKEFIGTGDGATTIFELPSRNTTSYKVYVDSLEQSVTFHQGTGEYGIDKIEFGIPISTGQIITADLKGNIRYKLRFKTDDFPENYQNFAQIKFSLNMLEVF